MTKKSQKNLQDSKKSSIFAPAKAQDVQQDVLKMVFEECSATPCDKWKPEEAMSIREMLIRTQRGQRLDVHTRFREEGIPDNMYQAKFDAEGRMLPDENEESFEHTPPDDVYDIVDVIRLQEETNNRKEGLKQKLQKQNEAFKLKRQKREEDDPSRSALTPEDIEFRKKNEDDRGGTTSEDD